MAASEMYLADKNKFEMFLYLAERAMSLIVGFVLLTAGASHIANPYYLLTRIISYDLVGPHTALAFALILPSLELVLGGCLVWRQMPHSTHLTAALLIAVFLLAQVIALSRGLKIDCGCFGPAAPELISAKTIARTAFLDVAMIVASLCEYAVLRRSRAATAE